ncbi:MAG: flagellar assembly protein FliW [Armatimonadetes bacterium]|nr:flagellar assembly protein FliW [Armatimonadota bacterium]
MKTLEGTRFGEITYKAKEVINFPVPLVGFDALTKFVVLSSDGSPFHWLQSVQEPEVAFLATVPEIYVPEYQPELPNWLRDVLQIEQDSRMLLLVTATIPHGKPTDMTINLAAPIVLNLDGKKGAQVILDDPAYTIKHRVFKESVEESRPAA